MRGFAPFHTCEEHQAGDLIEQEGRHGFPAPALFPAATNRTWSLFSPLSCCSRSTHSRQAWSASCCTVAAKEAARRSVVMTLTMSEGEVHAALIYLMCASTILGPHIWSPHMRGAFTFSLSDPNHACFHVATRTSDRGGVLAGCKTISTVLFATTLHLLVGTQPMWSPKIFWTRSSSSGTPVRCAVAPALTHHALPSRLRASSPFRLPSLSPPHTIRRHTARRPNPSLTRTCWLPDADGCGTIKQRCATTSPEQLKALRRRRETSRCMTVRCALATRVH